MLTSKFENRQAREYRGATVFQIQENISNRIILDIWRRKEITESSYRSLRQDVTK
jgi:hypothetical protein